MKKTSLIFLVLIIAGSGTAFADMVTFHIGYYIPRAQGGLWDLELENMTFTKSDFHNTLFSFSYEYFISNRVGLCLSIDAYNVQEVGSYEGYVGFQSFTGDWAYPDTYDGEFIPSHSLAVSNTPIHASVKFLPFGRGGKFIPYIGGGVGLYVWSVSIRGDIIDFSDERIDTQENVTVYPIYQITRRGSSNFAIGYQGYGGIMFPVANRISVDAGFKYSSADANLSDELYTDFFGVDSFDLGGYLIAVGINYWF